MTDLEQYRKMLWDFYGPDKVSEDDHGPTISLIFPIYPGLYGSTESVGESFFDKEGGVYLGTHHCD